MELHIAPFTSSSEEKIDLSNIYGTDNFAYDTAMGFDIRSSQQVFLKAGQITKVHTGIAVALVDDFVSAGLILAIRSGLAKRGIMLANGVGVIDPDYRGELIAMMYNTTNEDYEILPGDRIAQLIALPYFTPQIKIVDKLSETSRGTKGFGSSGR